MPDADVIVAIATAPGRGGIGVVRVSGAALDTMVTGIIRRELRPRQATFCRFLDGAGATIDDGIALLFPAPHSFTGESVLELQAHGGPVVLQMLVERCLDLGARLAEPGEFTRRAYLNGKLDLAQAEAVADLIDASSRQAARGAVRSLHGEFSQLIKAMQSSLSELRMLVEASLDFPEEDVSSLERERLQERLGGLQRQVHAVVNAARQGCLMRDGIRVVLAGRPNVGKSSLINRMAAEEISIVTEHPGTTRDLIRHHLHLRGVPIHLVDSAGLRSADDPVERIGVARSWREIATADTVVHVMDDQAGETEADREIERGLPPAVSRIRVFNKIDLTGTDERVRVDGAESTVWLSAHTGAGVDLLTDRILASAGWLEHEETPFIARERHVRALMACEGHLVQGKTVLHCAELFAEELRLAQRSLSEITGEVTPDDLLGEIFQRFCIGK